MFHRFRLKIDNFIEEFSRKISSSQINNVSPQKQAKEYKNEGMSTLIIQLLDFCIRNSKQLYNIPILNSIWCECKAFRVA